jgi:hypothetical protein
VSEVGQSHAFFKVVFCLWGMWGWAGLFPAEAGPTGSVYSCWFGGGLAGVSPTSWLLQIRCLSVRDVGDGLASSRLKPVPRVRCIAVGLVVDWLAFRQRVGSYRGSFCL